MLQQAPAYIESLVAKPFNKTAAKLLALNAASAGTLCSALADDARGALFSGLSTFADALWGIQRGYYSWATVKLYYACFYAAKAALARDHLAVFYVGHSPATLEAIAGSSIIFASGNSHTVVTNSYEKRFPSGALVSQDIDSEPAFRWMTRRREDVNYRLQKFSEPTPNEWLERVVDLGIRKAIGAYVADPTLYAYDAEHAILALPILAFLEEKKKVASFSSLGLSDTQITYIKSKLADDRGHLPSLSGALFG